MLVAIASGFLIAMLAPFVTRRLRSGSAWFFSVYPAGLTAYFLYSSPIIRGGGSLRESFAWAPSLGLSISLRLDGLSLLLGLLISGIGTLVVIYSGRYLKGHPQLGRFFAFLLAFMASMLGVVLADNLMLLFLFWELTSFTSYYLIGFEHENVESRQSALQALLVTASGGLALLAGLVLLGGIGGSFELSELLSRREALERDPRSPWALGLILVGAFTKSAQFPFHFWLPNAMAAPTPASAYLHSSTMVKAGVYLLARIQLLFVGTAAWEYPVTTIGAFTMVAGAYLAIRETYYKRLLAYTTISILGLLTMLLGMGSAYATKAAIVYLVAHALYKAGLFLVAGVVDHETGERDVKRLGGLVRDMPLVAIAAVLLGLSMAGVIGTSGFLAKEMLFEAGLRASTSVPLVAASLISGLLMVTVAGLVSWRPFFGARPAYSGRPGNGGFGLWMAPLLLSLAGVTAGLLPHILEENVSPAVLAVRGEPTEVHLKVWHGFNTALLLGTLALGGGILLFAFIAPVRETLQTIDRSGRIGPARWYESGLAGILRLAAWQTRVLQNGYLRFYLATVVLTTLLLVGGTLLFSRTLPPGMFALNDLDAFEVCLVAIIIVAVGMVVLVSNRLAAIAALGVVGYGVGILFVMYSAPDLAITQFLIETLTVILFVLVFYRLQEYRRISTRWQRTRDLTVSLMVGGMMAILVLLSGSTHWFPPISEYYGENAVNLAHGRNIVNVILVDFRGIDTLGEITVLAIAGMGAYALLRLRPAEPEEKP